MVHDLPVEQGDLQTDTAAPENAGSETWKIPRTNSAGVRHRAMKKEDTMPGKKKISTEIPSRYSSRDVAEILLIPMGTVSAIVMNGFLTPDVQRGAGRGKLNLFSFENLVEFRLFQLLTKRNGVIRAHAAETIRSLRKKLPKSAFSSRERGPFFLAMIMELGERPSLLTVELETVKDHLKIDNAHIHPLGQWVNIGFYRDRVREEVEAHQMARVAIWQSIERRLSKPLL
jgi:hypothetical protein